jgi:inner membrane protein
MPTVLGHLAPALALAPAFASSGTPRRLWVLGALCAVAPDLDVLAFAFGVPYAHPLGHRGLWHSVPFAALVAACVTALTVPRARPGFSRGRAFAYLFLAAASHGLLDAATDGGLGVALLAPFDDRRIFWPFRPISVSPLGLDAFLSARGAAVVTSELVWVWLPFGLIGISLAAAARRRAHPR